VTKPVVLDVEVTPEIVNKGQTHKGVTASTKVNRKDFGLNWNQALESGGVLVGDEVTINVDMELRKTNPAPAK